MHKNPNPTVYVKKLNFSCYPARCLKLVIWPTDKMLHTPGLNRAQKQDAMMGRETVMTVAESDPSLYVPFESDCSLSAFNK